MTENTSELSIQQVVIRPFWTDIEPDQLDSLQHDIEDLLTRYPEVVVSLQNIAICSDALAVLLLEISVPEENTLLLGNISRTVRGVLLKKGVLHRFAVVTMHTTDPLTISEPCPPPC